MVNLCFQELVAVLTGTVSIPGNSLSFVWVAMFKREYGWDCWYT